MRTSARPRPGSLAVLLLLLLLTDGCSGKRRRKPSKPRAAAATAAAAAVTTCAQCLAIQETIGRAIAQNISGIRRRAVHATLPIHDIVQGLCDTEAWAAERYQPELEQACVRATRPGWFELFEHWSAPGLAARRPGDKNVNEVYVHDPALTLRVKASACGQACPPRHFERLPRLETADECAICRALVTDSFATVALTRERPRSPADSSHDFVVGLLGRVCRELPTRRHVAPAVIAEVREECAAFAEEHQAALQTLITRREPSYAASLCARPPLGACTAPLSLAQLYLHDPDESLNQYLQTYDPDAAARAKAAAGGKREL